MVNVSKALTLNTVQAVEVEDLGRFVTENDWCPATFKGPIRNAANFLATEILALDVDSGCTIEEATTRFSGFKHIIAPSRSHRKEKNGVIADRFRVILFLSSPVTDNATFKATWNMALELWPFIDKACSDSCRFFYKSTSVYATNDGMLFPVEAPRPVAKKIYKPEVKVMPRPVVEFMNEGVEENWNSTLFKMAKLMQEAGHTEEETVETLGSMVNPYYNGQLDRADIRTIQSAFSRPGSRLPELEWPALVPTKKGNLVVDTRNQDNYIYLIRDVLGTKLQFNELRHMIESNGKEFDDFDFSDLRMKCRSFGLAPTVEMLDDVIRFLAKEHTYHPFKDKLTGAWDGQDRITELYKTLTVSGEELPIYHTYIRRWLIGIIARVYNPGSHQNVLVLQGPQGKGKSRWFEKFAIAPGTFHEGSVDPSSKDDKIKTASVVVWVLSELDGITRKRDVAELKSFLTDTTFDVRMPYDKYSKQLKAICSFAASVNEHSFLADQTGNRRFLVIPIEALDPNHTIDMVQVFLQAKAAYESGERYWFNGEEIAEVNKINEDYVPNSRIEYITAHISPGTDEMTADEIFSALEYKDNRTQADYVQLGHVLTKKGVQKFRKSVNGTKLTAYLVDKKTLTKLAVAK